MSLLVIAVEKVPATKRQGSGIKQSGFVAGSARLAILPAATAKELGAFVGASVAPGARVITDGFDGYVDLGQDFRFLPGTKNDYYLVFSSYSLWSL